jgi:hypothetical protein
LANVATDTYVGDGAATQAIASVGFQPRFVLIWKEVDNTQTPAPKCDQDGLGALVWRDTVGPSWFTDQIISLDADGFTVGDGTTFLNITNVNLVTYTYVAFR